MAHKINNIFYIYLFNVSREVTKDLKTNASLIYAEDLVIALCKDIGINPIGRQLFGLYHITNKVWMSNNEKLCDLRENKKLQFRLRFRPYDVQHLKNIDPKAFQYYFYQIRFDFHNGKYSNGDIEIVYGLSVTDMLRELLEKEISIETALDSLELFRFIPIQCKKLYHKYLLKDKIKDALWRAWNNSNKNADFVIQEFIESFITNLMPGYGTESYNAVLDNPKSPNNPNHVIVQYEPYHENGISIRSIHDTKDKNRQKICDISDLCFISVSFENKNVEISRRNGIPCYFTFSHDLLMKSFVSLLDGYYRLSEKWSFNICSEINSPSLKKLKMMRCHGPVGLEFAYRKLREKGNNVIGTYIVRESMSHYDQYKLDVIIRDGYIMTYKIEFIYNGFIIEGQTNSFETLSELTSQFVIRNESKENITLHFCLPSSEYDQSPYLLLCKSHDLIQIKNVSESQISWPKIIPSRCLKQTNTNFVNNLRYSVYLSSLQNQKVIVKEIKSEPKISQFLRTVSEWAHLRNDTIIMCKGVCLYQPLSIVLEYLPLGPFDAFLKENQTQLEKVDLIESITYIARGLWFLQENKIFHGHIRCHNIMVADYSSNSLRVKLCDPISDGDYLSDHLWVPPEYSERTSAFDVWSFGTTLWEIFSYGKKPIANNVNELPHPNACPPEIWSLMYECWNPHAVLRKQPQSIVRDVSQILYEVYNSRRTVNNYSTLVYSEKSKINKIKSFFGSTISLTSDSVASVQSDITILTGNETSLDTQFTMDLNESTDDLNTEPWVIDSNQLKLEKILGQGCYGQVMKAVYTIWGELKEVVAVKRIKSIPSEAGFKDMKREFEIMKELNHPNIVKIKGFVEEPQTMFALVMEYVELGSLVTLLKMHYGENGSPPLPLIKFAYDISNGMEYLESKSIVHRDLAARNILVTAEHNVKISDFGLAQFIDPKDQCYRIKTQRELPWRWYAPESLQYWRFSHKSDIWSYGVVLWEMYSYGENPVYPVSDADLADALNSGVRLCRPNECPAEIYKLICKCWRLESHDRPSFTEVKMEIEEMSK